jgi:hypothetical protein
MSTKARQDIGSFNREIDRLQKQELKENMIPTVTGLLKELLENLLDERAKPLYASQGANFHKKITKDDAISVGMDKEDDFFAVANYARKTVDIYEASIHKLPPRALTPEQFVAATVLTSSGASNLLSLITYQEAVMKACGVPALTGKYVDKKISTKLYGEKEANEIKEIGHNYEEWLENYGHVLISKILRADAGKSLLGPMEKYPEIFGKEIEYIKGLIKPK